MSSEYRVEFHRPIRPTLKPLTNIEDSKITNIPEFQLLKSLRSFSNSSNTSTSSNSSTYSRLADDILDKFVNQDSHSIIDLWSGGNIRLNGRNLTSTPRDSEDLLNALKNDERFEFVKLIFFDNEGEDWKVGTVSIIPMIAQVLLCF
uniref:Uncharacterized protein n=1 Tax=Kwoniella pini CBS 10737 TaxID=1296096 RepID=A0A1B9HYC6_9TREE|nr:uncharacterized protein I206_06140 [Kwoniella pini CBS 10737]OCF48272.1 hypothetical protein I206_06140 [Kwoniella pini CBS 10737]